MKSIIVKGYNNRPLFTSLILASLVTVSPMQSVQAAPNQSVVAGSICQALDGNQDSRLTHNVDWVHNKSGNTWVTCPLVRDEVHGNINPRVRVRVFRPNGAGALDCNFFIKSVTGATEFIAGAATTGWSYVDMQAGKTFNGALYSVRCRLPAGAGIQKIVLDE